MEGLTPEHLRRSVGDRKVDDALAHMGAAARHFNQSMMEHQKYAALGMRFMEEGRNGRLVGDGEPSYASDMGVFAMEVGTGKTLSILALALTWPTVQDDPVAMFRTIDPQGALGNQVRRVKTHRYCLPQLLLIPPGLTKQWSDAVVQHAGMTLGLVSGERWRPSQVMVLTRYAWKAPVRDGDPEGVKSWRVLAKGARTHEREPEPEETPTLIIMTSTAFHSFCKSPESRECVFQRVIVDEADTIFIPGFKQVTCHYFWMVTATPGNLRENHAHTPGLRLSKPRDTEFWDAITLTVDESFIRGNMPALPAPNLSVVLYRDLSFLQESVWRIARQALEAGDVSGAIDIMGCASSALDGIVAAATTHIQHEIDRANTQIRRLEAGDTAEDDLRRHVSACAGQIRGIMERVTGASECPITMQNLQEDGVQTAVSPCCQNRFLATALVRAISHTSRCPMCRAPMMCRDVVMVVAPGAAQHSRPPINREDAVRRKFEAIITEDPDAKIIVVHRLDVTSMMDTLKTALGDRGDVIQVKGNLNLVAKAMKAFREGLPMRGSSPPVRVVFMDPTNYASGHNMEFVTHIIKVDLERGLSDEMSRKVEGVAQRLGRTTPLEIIEVADVPL